MIRGETDTCYQGSAAAGTPERREKKGIHRAQTLHNMRDSKEVHSVTHVAPLSLLAANVHYSSMKEPPVSETHEADYNTQETQPGTPRDNWCQLPPTPACCPAARRIKYNAWDLCLSAYQEAEPVFFLQPYAHECRSHEPGEPLHLTHSTHRARCVLPFSLIVIYPITCY
jgi:hypothetical protein